MWCILFTERNEYLQWVVFMSEKSLALIFRPISFYYYTCNATRLYKTRDLLIMKNWFCYLFTFYSSNYVMQSELGCVQFLFCVRCDCLTALEGGFFQSDQDIAQYRGISVLHWLYPTLNEVEGGILVSPCPSFRLWTESCPLCIFHNTSRMSISYLHILSASFRRCVRC